MKLDLINLMIEFLRQRNISKPVTFSAENLADQFWNDFRDRNDLDDLAKIAIERYNAE
jgi:hypothetical protein